jgi:hypothetical protein
LPAFRVQATTAGTRQVVQTVAVVDGGHPLPRDPGGQPFVHVNQLLAPSAETLASRLGLDAPEASWAKLIADARQTANFDAVGSPLAWPTADAGRLGRFSANEEFDDVLSAAGRTTGAEITRDSKRGTFRVEVFSEDHAVGGLIWWEVDGVVLGALASTRDAFVAVLPPDTTEVQVRYPIVQPVKRLRSAML